MSAVKPIRLTYKGTEYTLEFNRKTAQALEKQGFNGNEIDVKPTVMIPMLYAASFRMHHPYIKPDILDEIFVHIPKKGEFVEKLAELYNEPILALISDPEGDEGNASWEI